LPLVFVALVAVSVISTISTGWGGFAVGLTVVSFLRRWPARAWARRALRAGCVTFAGFMALITIATLVPPGQGDFPILGPWGDIKLVESGRLAAWIATTRTIAKAPLLGIGADEPVAHFKHEWAHQGALGGAQEREFQLEAHNVLLGVWAQMSVVGLAGLAGLVLWLQKTLWARGRHDAGAAWLAGAMAGGVLYHGTFGSLEDARHLWIFSGIATGGFISPKHHDRS
jgi:O-antigen ligase